MYMYLRVAPAVTRYINLRNKVKAVRKPFLSYLFIYLKSLCVLVCVLGNLVPLCLVLGALDDFLAFLVHWPLLLATSVCRG